MSVLNYFKFKLRKKAGPSLLTFFINFLLMFLVFVESQQSNWFFQNTIASEISSYAISANSNSKYAYIGFTNTSSQDYSTYNEIFFKAKTLNDGNFNRSGYSVKTMFDNLSPLFSSNYSYGVIDEPLKKITNGASISILASPLNWQIDGIHEIWGLKMITDEMDLQIGEGCSNFCYIPISWANAILGINDSNAVDKEKLCSLIGKPITIVFKDKNNNEEQLLSWTISNIFLEDGTFKYLYEQYGWFIPSYTANLPTYNYSSIVVQFGKSIFTNRVYLQKIIDTLDINYIYPYIHYANINTSKVFNSADFLENLKTFNLVGKTMEVFCIEAFAICFIAYLVEVCLTFKRLNCSELFILQIFSLLAVYLLFLLIKGNAVSKLFTYTIYAISLYAFSLIITNLLIRKSKIYKEKAYAFAKDIYKI